MAEQTAASRSSRLPPPETELSALDQIRQAEAEITRRVAAARLSAEHSLAAAQKEAAQMVVQARETGLKEGQVRYQEILAAAESEAHHLVDQAQVQVSERRQVPARRMEFAVQQIIDLVIGSDRT